ncbi:hypothetical protein QS458_24760, partial [Escherichia coli]|nr:hypothetical protein [Escherichia coli]
MPIFPTVAPYIATMTQFFGIHFALEFLTPDSVIFTSVLKWSTKTGHRVRVFSSIDFPIRLVVTHHYIRAVLVRC